MKKLEQLLYKHSDSYQKSASTNTIYFKFGEITVRYSDHAAFKDSQSVQFNIVKPENDNNYYTVYHFPNPDQTVDLYKYQKH